MKFRKSARRDTPEVNLIAFIDVLLVILIFLMVSTTFSKFSALKLSLPTATTNPEQAQPKTVSVAIDASGSVTVDGRRLGLIEPKTLAAALKQVVGANTDSVVEIHADAMATHQSVVNVMEAARLAGLQRLSFATRNPPR
ncbi:MAG: ExbD/TolR family protein [Burkholderiaceae bacterium]|jgi:biopolymer transport protein ExbD|nr:biopolymer transporter ExbD [Oxalobacteraceae bacterium]